MHTFFVSSAVFSPDGSKILTASADKTAKLWDLTGNLLADLQGHTDGVNSAVFSPDGKRILTASNDLTTIIWPTPEGIMEWLKTAPIPKLTPQEKEELGIFFFSHLFFCLSRFFLSREYDFTHIISGNRLRFE